MVTNATVYFTAFFACCNEKKKFICKFEVTGITGHEHIELLTKEAKKGLVTPWLS